MWRTSKRATAWKCADCTAQGLREMRGNCGGPFADALLAAEGCHEYPDGWEGARRRPDGLIELTGDRTLRPSRATAGMVFTSCPVAAASRPFVADAFRAHRAVERGTLNQFEPEPSAALMEAVDVVALALGDLLAYEREADAIEREAARGVG